MYAVVGVNSVQVTYSRSRKGLVTLLSTVRGLHRPFQSVQLTDVVGQEVVVDVAPEFCPESANDAEIIIIDELGARVRFATSFISRAHRPDHVPGDLQHNVPVDAAPITLVSLVVSMHAADLVAEEARGFVAGVRNQSLF